MKKIVKLLFLIFLALLIMNCAGKKPKTYEDFNIYYQKGQKYYEKEKWLKAVDNFRLYILNNPGGELADDAQFYLGECYFNRKEYLLAVAEFTQLVERYKYSELLIDGYYKIAHSYYKLSPRYERDQENTEMALRQLQEFIDSYPGTDYAQKATKNIDELRNKLGRKLYESAKIYRKLSQWDAAILYCDEMLNSYYDSEWAVWAKYEKAYCYIKKREFDNFAVVETDIKSDESLNQNKKGEMLAKLEKMNIKEKQKIEKEKRKKLGKERRKTWWF